MKSMRCFIALLLFASTIFSANAQERRGGEQPQDGGPPSSCPPGYQAKPKQEWETKSRMFDAGKRAALIKLAMNFSRLIYQLPGVEYQEQAKETWANYRSFYDGAREMHYEVAHRYINPATGLKLSLFRPKSDTSPQIWVLAFTGSEAGLLDWIVDANLGRPQFKNFQEQLSIHLPRYLPVAGKEVELLVTGHSLGGGLAQAAAYEIDREMKKRELSLKIHLITWNAFGAVDLILKSHPELKRAQVIERNLRLGETLHYSYCGDPVSRVGQHWQGSKFELNPENNKKCKLKVSEIKNAHVLKTTNCIVEQDITELLEAKTAKARSSKALGRVALNRAMDLVTERIIAWDVDKIGGYLCETLDGVSSCRRNNAASLTPEISGEDAPGYFALLAEIATIMVDTLNTHYGHNDADNIKKLKTWIAEHDGCPPIGLP